MAEQKIEQIDGILKSVKNRDPNQDEFNQAVEEVLKSLSPLLNKYPKYYRVLPAMCEPERIFQFRVPWVDDKGITHIQEDFVVNLIKQLVHIKVV